MAANGDHLVSEAVSRPLSTYTAIDGTASPPGSMMDEKRSIRVGSFDLSEYVNVTPMDVYALETDTSSTSPLTEDFIEAGALLTGSVKGRLEHKGEVDNRPLQVEDSEEGWEEEGRSQESCWRTALHARERSCIGWQALAVRLTSVRLGETKIEGQWSMRLIAVWMC